MNRFTRSLLALAAAGALCFGAAPASATPSLQVWIPSTDTQPGGTVHVGVDNRTTVFKSAEDGGRDFPTDFGLTVGVVDISLIGLEIGVDLKEQSDDPVFFNAKMQIKEDSAARFFPAIAIGIYDAGTQSDKTNVNITYVLVAKTLPIVGRLAVGYYVGNDDILRDAGGEKENDGFLASFDRTLAEIDDRLWIVVDYMDGQNQYGALSFGLSWRFSPQVSALLGYNIYNDETVGGENTVTIQFDIDF